MESRLLDEIARAADEHLVAMYEEGSLTQVFVRKHPDYVRRNLYAQETDSQIDREEETLP